MPGASQGESQARSPGAVKTRLSRTTRVRDFSISAFPQRSLWRERPPEASVNRAPLRAPVNTGRCCTSVQKGGVAPSTSTPLVRRAGAPGERGTCEAQPRFALSQRTRKMLVIPRLMPRFGKMRNHNGEGVRPLREKRCGCQKHAPPTCATRSFSVAH